MNKEINDRHFYHSFPRPDKSISNGDNIKKGLDILESIKKIGLVLAPEIVVWQEPLKQGATREIVTKPIRISFTKRSHLEIKEHGKTFGTFSIGFDIDTLRKLGAMPVIYMPQNLKDDEELSMNGIKIVAELYNIKYILTQIRDLKEQLTLEHLQKQNPGIGSIEGATLQLKNIDSVGSVVNSYDVKMENIQSFLSYLGFNNSPFTEMVGSLSFIQNLISQTEYDIKGKLLDYYEQREWRLLSGIALNGKQQARKLSVSEKENLLSIDTKFWSKELEFDNKTIRRVDDALIIDKFKDMHISDLISTVFVPQVAYDRAKKIFGDKVKCID